MKILKHGDWESQETTKQFECETCGCVFLAVYGEYKRGLIKRPTADGLKPYMKYEALCPECGHFAELLVPVEIEFGIDI